MIGAPIGRPIFGRVNLTPLFADGVLSAAGVATPEFTGAPFHDGVLNAAGVSTPAFAAESFHDGVLNAAGVASAPWVGILAADGAFVMAGTGAAVFTAESFHDGAFVMAGTSTEGMFYSAYRLFSIGNPSSATVTGLQTATDATLIRDPFTWP